MRVVWRRLLAAPLLLLLCGAGAVAAPEQRVALVVGNGDYTNPMWKLKNPANDAKRVAAMLRKAGFDVIEQEDLTRRGLIQAARTFAEKLNPGGVGLFYYAGHGIQAQGANYIMPTDAALVAEDDLKYEAFNVQDILDKLTDARVRLSILMLDACRDNPFAKSHRSSVRGLTPIDPPRGTIISYATAPGKVAADGDTDDSVYTEALVKAATVPGRRLQEVFEKVTDEVEERTHRAQTPWTNSSFRGDFSFFSPLPLPLPVPVTPVAPITPPTVSPDVQEQAAWSAVVGSTTPAPYEAFLKRFKSGVFADIARAKIEDLKTKQVIEELKAKQAATDLARAKVEDEIKAKQIAADVARAKIEDLKAKQAEEVKAKAAAAVLAPPPKVEAVPVEQHAFKIERPKKIEEPTKQLKRFAMTNPAPQSPRSSEVTRPEPPPPVDPLAQAKSWCGSAVPDLIVQGCTEIIQASGVGQYSRADALNNRGVGYSKKGQTNKALLDFDEAIRLNPSNTLAIANRDAARHDREQADAAAAPKPRPAAVYTTGNLPVP